MPAPSVTATAVDSGGSFTAGTYFYRVTAVDKDGQESLPSREVSVTVAANGKVNLTISNVGAASYKIYRGNGSFLQNSVRSTTNTNFEDTASAGTPATTPTVGKAMTRLLTDNMVSAAKTAASIQALLSSIANQGNTFIDTTLDDGETIPQ
jgi:fibronectin type 3 domain-containing protein